MTRFFLSVIMIGAGAIHTNSQSLFTPRAVGIGAYAPLVSDSRSFTENPAGIVNIKDWDLSVSTYMANVSSNKGFVFEGLSLGKRFLDRYALALQYAPGSSMEFVIPTALTLVSTSPTSIDQRVSYDEPFASAFALKLSSALSVGISARYRTEKIVDTQYQLVSQDTNSYIERLPDVKTTTTIWNLDFGVQWRPTSEVTLTATTQNLVQAKQDGFSQEFAAYHLPNARQLDLGIGYTINQAVTVAGQYSTSGVGALGSEWRTGVGFAVRGGAYLSRSESPFVVALACGLGWSYRFFEADVSYLRFLSQVNRSGSSSISGFDPSSITSIDLNRYTSDRLQLSLKAIFGSVRTSLVSIEAVEIQSGIYPSAYEALAYRPLGKVRVKNISDQPVEARARFFVEKYMDAPTESQPVYLLAGETREIPLTAVFNDRVKGVAQMLVSEGNVYVSATPAEDYDDKYATRLLIHGKNDWDGSVYSLRYFVTPNDPAVIRYTRDALLQQRDSLSVVSKELELFRKAQVLFNTFAGKLVYVNDPKQSADYVQYPSETLELRGGDCDDMTTCFSSLLNSVGISTAFVDVVPPADSSGSHIYLLFDTGLDPKFDNAISPNPKRFVVRKGKDGTESIWLPIETTLITRGFDAAWSEGAQEYFDDVEVGLGLIKGWVKIVDVY